LTLGLFTALACSAQTVVSEGTRVRVRLEQQISAATAEESQVVEFTVTDAVKEGETVVIAEGARAGSGAISVLEWIPTTCLLDFSADPIYAAIAACQVSGIRAVRLPSLPS
jgi:hypothetical protein